MPLETIEATIDGTRYRFGQLPWLDGVPIYQVLVRASGDTLIATLLAMNPEERAKLANGDKAAALPFAMRIIGNLSREDIDTIITGLGRVIEVAAGETDAFVPVLGLKRHFDGRYLHLVKVLWEAAAHNFSNPT